MKNLYKSSLAKATGISLLVCLTLIFACKKPTEGINVLVSSNSLFPAPTVLKFTNADSTSGNKPGNFHLTILGSGAKYVQTTSGGVDFTVLDGILALSLTKDAQPSVTNPISFTVNAILPGFAPIVQNIVITKNELSIFNIRALEYNRPANGTTVAQNVLGLSTGVIAGNYAISTPLRSTMSEQATLSFQGGTELRDGNGKLIPAVNLELSIAQFGTQSQSSLQALPGGTVTAGINKADGSILSGSVNFVTAGLLQITLKADAVPVKQFSKPVNITMQINSKMTNFATGSPVKAGDIVPYWSMDETTGRWTNEGNTVLKSDANGKLYASIQISHLSCWSVGWSWGATGSYGSCGSSLNVIIKTSDPNFKGGSYNVSLQTLDGTYLGGAQGITIYNGANITLSDVPNVPHAKIVVSGGPSNITVQSSSFEPCSAGSISVEVPVSTDNTVTVAVDVNGLCNGKSVTILPSTTFEMYQQTGSTFTDVGTIQLVNGKGSTGMQLGTNYYLTTTYNGVFYKCDPFSVSKADFPINSAGFNVAAKYDAATNTLTFTGTIPINCN